MSYQDHGRDCGDLPGVDPDEGYDSFETSARMAASRAAEDLRLDVPSLTGDDLDVVCLDDREQLYAIKLKLRGRRLDPDLLDALSDRDWSVEYVTFNQLRQRHVWDVGTKHTVHDRVA